MVDSDTLKHIPKRNIHWQKAWRIIPSQFPPINLFERITDPNDLDAVFALESLTNDRLRDEVGDLQLVPQEDRVCGPGSSAIMAAFTHLNPEGSRFSDGRFGVFYAASSLQAAIKETVFHREQFLRATQEVVGQIDMRVLVCEVKAQLYDVRDTEHFSSCYTEDYASSQQLAVQIRAIKSDGVVYRSVRDPEGECVAVFRPKCVTQCHQERHLCYCWDGERIVRVYEKSQLVDIV